MLRNECPGAGQKRSVKEHHTKLIGKNSREAERRNVLREAEDPEFRRNNRHDFAFESFRNVIFSSVRRTVGLHPKGTACCCPYTTES